MWESCGCRQDLIATIGYDPAVALEKTADQIRYIRDR